MTTTDITTDAPRRAGEYVIFYCTQTADDHDDPCCLCGEDAADFGCSGGPGLGLLDRGPLCGRCIEREPEWVQHMAAAVDEIDSAAMHCPPELRAGLARSIAMVTKNVVEWWAE